MRIGNNDLIESGTLTDMATSITSTPTYLGHTCNFAIQLEFTGSPNGVLKMQVSSDEGDPSFKQPNNYANVTHWSDIAGSSQTITEAGTHMWEVANAGTCWVRFVYTRSSGTGTLTSAICNVKGV